MPRTSNIAPIVTNPYLEGNYAPVADEVTAFDLPVIGELPTELTGRYLRNGPNPAGPVDPRIHHWFLGDGMVHGIRLDGGRAAWYRNRFVRSPQLEATTGLADAGGPSWDGSPSELGANTNVGGFAGTTWAMIEAGGTPVELTYELESIARNDFNGTLPGPFTAHPKIDPVAGEMHAMVYGPAAWFDHVQYVVVGQDDSGLAKVTKTVDIPLIGATMMHDMSLTERYAVCYDQPVTLSFERMAEGHFPFAWNPDHGNRVGLLRRDAVNADDIIWIDVPLGYCFHPMNAYDTADGNVIVDLCQYPKVFDEDPNGPFEVNSLPRLERWELNPKTRTVTVTVIDDTVNEFPRHRGSLTAKPYRYGYAAAVSANPTEGWPTLKHDLLTGARTAFDHGAGRAAGEPIFVPRGADDDDGATSEEDDGWLITLVHDLGTERAELVVLDAQDFDRGYVARVPLPQRIPFGFHGNWVSDRSVPPPIS